MHATADAKDQICQAPVFQPCHLNPQTIPSATPCFTPSYSVWAEPIKKTTHAGLALNCGNQRHMILETPESVQDYVSGKQIQEILFPAAYRH